MTEFSLNATEFAGNVVARIQAKGLTVAKVERQEPVRKTFAVAGGCGRSISTRTLVHVERDGQPLGYVTFDEGETFYDIHSGVRNRYRGKKHVVHSGNFGYSTQAVMNALGVRQ